MTYSERYPGAGRRQAWTLAVSLAVHALLLFAWLHFGSHVQLPVDAPQPLSVLLLPTPAQPPTAAAAPRPAPVARPRAEHRRAVEAPIDRPAAPSRAEPASTVAPPQVPAATAPSAWDILNAAKQAIHAGDGETRAKKADALRPGDSAWRRFENAVAAAHADKSPGPVTESYTAPDGQVFYRTRSNGKVVCRKSGNTGPPTPWRSEAATQAGAGREAILGMGGHAGGTLCPDTDPGFVRH